MWYILKSGVDGKNNQQGQRRWIICVCNRIWSTNQSPLTPQTFSILSLYSTPPPRTSYSPTCRAVQGPSEGVPPTTLDAREGGHFFWAMEGVKWRKFRWSILVQSTTHEWNGKFMEQKKSPKSTWMIHEGWKQQIKPKKPRPVPSAAPHPIGGGGGGRWCVMLGKGRGSFSLIYNPPPPPPPRGHKNSPKKTIFLNKDPITCRLYFFS